MTMKIRLMVLAAVAAFLSMSCEKESPDVVLTYENMQQKSPKRGVSFNFSTLPEQDCALLGPACTWSYNWSGNIPAAKVEAEFSKYGMEFIQMAWNDIYNPDNFRNYKKAHPEARYILAFNEPNLTDQAEMTPAQAASHWPALKALAAELGMKLISPAMNYGTLAGYNDPWKWLDEFFAQPGVSIDDVDGIAIHCYMGSAAAVKNYVEGFKKYGKPIWLTEFCAWDSKNISADNQMKYMVETINYLESDPDIFRYAWFIPRGNGEAECHNSLLTSPSGFGNTSVSLTDLGRVFVDMSTFDKSLYYSPGQLIPAEHYVAVNGAVHLKPSSDNVGLLELNDLVSGTWAEYQIDVPSAGEYVLEARYSAYRDSEIVFTFGDGTAVPVEMSNTASVWETVSATVSLGAGNQIFRVAGNSGASPSLNWFRLSAK